MKTKKLAIIVFALISNCVLPMETPKIPDPIKYEDIDFNAGVDKLLVDKVLNFLFKILPESLNLIDQATDDKALIEGISHYSEILTACSNVSINLKALAAARKKSLLNPKHVPLSTFHKENYVKFFEHAALLSRADILLRKALGADPPLLMLDQILTTLNENDKRVVSDIAILQAFQGELDRFDNMLSANEQDYCTRLVPLKISLERLSDVDIADFCLLQ